jgi:hypothetical protein
MLVAGLLASMESNMGGVSSPATAASAGLQGTQLLYGDDLLPGPTPVKTEREGGLGTLGFPGGGVPREFHWCFFLRRMFGIIVWGKLGVIECVYFRREFLMWRSMTHRNWRFEKPRCILWLLQPNSQNFAAYEAPDLAVSSLTDKQFSDLTQELHPLNDWNRIILAIKAGRFDNELEYEEIKQRASKKSVFSDSFPLMKRVEIGI